MRSSSPYSGVNVIGVSGLSAVARGFLTSQSDTAALTPEGSRGSRLAEQDSNPESTAAPA